MRRILIIVVAVGLVAGAAVALREPLRRLVCPPRITNFGQLPRPDVPVVPVNGARWFAEAGDTFAVASFERPRIEGDATVVRHQRTQTFATEVRCGRVVDGYRYHIYVAEHAGDVTIGGHPVQIAARP
jgi:hypothetical protein